MTAAVTSRHRRVVLLGYIEGLNEMVIGPNIHYTQLIVLITVEQILV